MIVAFVMTGDSLLFVKRTLKKCRRAAGRQRFDGELCEQSFFENFFSFGFFAT